MSKQIILNECLMVRDFEPICELEIGSYRPAILIHVANDEVICHYTNVAIGPLIGILDALKDRLLEQQNDLQSNA